MAQRTPTILSIETLTFLFLTSITTVMLWGEVITLGLFIVHIGVGWLPWALLLDVGVRMSFTNLYMHLSARLSPLWEFIGACGIAVIGVLIARQAIMVEIHVGYIGLFLIHRFFSIVFVYHLTQFITYLYNAATSADSPVPTRIFVLTRVTSGLGLLVFSFGAIWLSQTVLIDLWLAGIVACAFSIIAISQIPYRHVEETILPQSALSDQDPDKDETGNLRGLFQNRFSRQITLNAFYLGFLTTLLFFLSLRVLEQRFPSDYGVVIAFLGMVYSTGIWLVIPIQYRALSFLLKRTHAAYLTMLYTGSLAIAFITLWFITAPVMVIFSEILRKPFYEGIYTSLERLILRSLSGGAGIWVRRLIMGYIEPSGRFLAALILLAYQNDKDNIAIFVVGILAIGALMITAYEVSRSYQQSLRTSIREGNYGVFRRSDEDVLLYETDIVQTFIAQLRQNPAQERDVLLMAEILAETRMQDSYQTLRTIWEQSSSSLQAELLPFVIKQGFAQRLAAENIALIETTLSNDDASLRYAALKMIEIYPQLDPEYRIASLLIDADPMINATAAAVLLHHPSPLIQKAAFAQLRWLSKDKRSSIRVRAVHALVKGSTNRFGEIIVPLDVDLYMQDPATHVRQSVLPAASLDQLVAATGDPSPAVRLEAAIQLRLRLFEGARSALSLALQEIESQTLLPETLQIHALHHYWYLLATLARVDLRMSRRRIKHDLYWGLEHLTMLSTMIVAFTQTDHEAWQPILRQLKQARRTLCHAIFEVLTIHYPQYQVPAILWKLETSPNDYEIQSALADLQRLTHEEIAMFLYQVLRDTYIPEGQSILLPMVIRVLLVQENTWYPLITLYCLSQYATESLIDSHEIQAVLHRIEPIPYEPFREAVRLLKGRFFPTKQPLNEQFPVEFSHYLYNELEGGIVLSLLERMVFLRNVPLFDQLQLPQLQTLARVCQEKTAATHQVIIRQGDLGESLYIIVEGQVRVERVIADTQATVHLNTLTASQVFGEISLFAGGTRNASVIAETPVLLLSIERNALSEALEENPSIAITILQAMARRINDVTEEFDRRTSSVHTPIHPTPVDEAQHAPSPEVSATINIERE